MLSFMKWYYSLWGFLLMACQENTPQKSTSLKKDTIRQAITQKMQWDKLEKQVFTIHADSNSFVVGKAGVVCWFQAESFTDSTDKKVQGSIQIELQEAQSLLDSLQIRLQADSKPFRSVGVLSLTAQKDGKRLKIKTQDNVWIAIPATQKSEKIQVLVGESKNTEMFWKPEASQKFKKMQPTNPAAQVLAEYGIAIEPKSLQKSHQETSNFLKRVDEQFVLKSNRYVYKPSAKEVYEETLETSFVSKIRQKLKAIEEAQKYLKEQEQFEGLKKTQFQTAWKNFTKTQKIQHSNPTFYEYPLQKTGWLALGVFTE